MGFAFQIAITLIEVLQASMKEIVIKGKKFKLPTILFSVLFYLNCALVILLEFFTYKFNAHVRYISDVICSSSES